MGKPAVRTGQGPGKVSREEFSRRFQERFVDPAFDAERAQLARIEDIAWTTYQGSHKAPLRAHPGPSRPDYAWRSLARSRARIYAPREIATATLPAPRGL